MKKLIGAFVAHKVISTIVSVLVIIFIILFGLRIYNKHIKNKSVDEVVSGAAATLLQGYFDEDGNFVEGLTDEFGNTVQGVLDDMGNFVEGYVDEAGNFIDINAIPEETPTPAPTDTPAPDSALTVDGREEREREEGERRRAEEIEERKIREAEEARIREAIRNQEPTFGDKSLIWASDGVPETMVDGSSCKEYFHQVSLSDFGSKWGSKLTRKDKLTKKLYLVGVDQNPDDTNPGYSCESLGWLIDHLDTMPDNACVKFTDLNIIGKLNSRHVAVLCSYDWYSAFGLQDTLVVFEDISGTLRTGSYRAGEIFSAYVYRHNIKVKHVNGQRVVCVQYARFGRKG